MGRKVAVYARVSTEHEAQLSALENQIQYYDDELAKHPDWELYDRYIDEGITGTSTKKRKNFMRMMADAEKGKFDLIVTREVSRFARNTVDTLQETRRLKKIGVEVYFTEDNIWTFNDEDGELKLTIMATLAQNESRKTSQRVKAGQRISFENGVFYGTGNILGYDKVGDMMVINEEQAEIVRLVFREYLSGKGSGQICRELERKGYKTSTGLKKWQPPSILRMLQNSFYCGIIVYRKSFVPDFLEQKKKKNEGEVEKIVVKGKHVPIISEEDFNKVQKMIEEKTIQDKNNKVVGVKTAINFWSKKLECDCGSSFSRRINNTLQDGTKTYHFKCNNQKSNGSKQSRLKKGLPIEDSCDIKEVQEWKLVVAANVVYSTLCRENQRIIQEINKSLEETIKSLNSKTELSREIKLYNTKIESIKEKKKALLDAFISKLISQEEYKETRDELDKELNVYIHDKLELEYSKGVPIETVKDRIEQLKKDVKNSLYEEKGNFTMPFIYKFTKKIIIRKDCIEWHLNYLEELKKLRRYDKTILSNLKKNNLENYIGNIYVEPKDIYKYKDIIDIKTIKQKEPIWVKIFV